MNTEAKPAPTFEQMKAFLVQHYKHDRLYGVAPWKECPNYGDVVVNSNLEYLSEHGMACISQFEAMRGQPIWFVFKNGSIKEIDGALARAALRQNSAPDRSKGLHALRGRVA